MCEKHHACFYCNSCFFLFLSSAGCPTAPSPVRHFERADLGALAGECRDLRIRKNGGGAHLRWKNSLQKGASLLFRVCVCAPHVKLLFPPIYPQCKRCPCRRLLLLIENRALWSQTTRKRHVANTARLIGYAVPNAMDAKADHEQGSAPNALQGGTTK